MDCPGNKVSPTMNGSVLWITGYSGSGKTTVARQLVDYFRKGNKAVVHLDGDELRQAIGQGIGYSSDERKHLSFLYSKLCKLLSDQGLMVIWSGIAMFNEVRQWNRENIRRYYEVYLKVPLDELKTRDQKQLYSQSAAEKIEPVVGLTLRGEEPKQANLVVPNFGSTTPQDSVKRILDGFHEWITNYVEIIN